MWVSCNGEGRWGSCGSAALGQALPRSMEVPAWGKDAKALLKPWVNQGVTHYLLILAHRRSHQKAPMHMRVCTASPAHL